MLQGFWTIFSLGAPEEYRHCFTITNSTKVGGLSGREADMNGFIYLLPDFVCYFMEE